MSIDTVRPCFHLNPIEGDGNEGHVPLTTEGAGSEERWSAGADDEAEAIHAPDEEVKQTKTVKSPPMPTQEEVDAHG